MGPGNEASWVGPGNEVSWAGPGNEASWAGPGNEARDTLKRHTSKSEGRAVKLHLSDRNDLTFAAR